MYPFLLYPEVTWLQGRICLHLFSPFPSPSSLFVCPRIPPSPYSYYCGSWSFLVIHDVSWHPPLPTLETVNARVRALLKFVYVSLCVCFLAFLWMFQCLYVCFGAFGVRVCFEWGRVRVIVPVAFVQVQRTCGLWTVTVTSRRLSLSLHKGHAANVEVVHVGWCRRQPRLNQKKTRRTFKNIHLVEDKR